MSLNAEHRLSDSPYIETIERVTAVQSGSAICPANGRWYMLVTRQQDKTHLSVVGPLTKASPTTYIEGAEFLFIKFKIGTYLRHIPVKTLLDDEIILPDATCNAFWLDSFAWQFPDYNNIETFVDKLARNDILVNDSVVSQVLQDEESNLAERTVRHRFLQSTGLTRRYIQQIERARHAKTILEQGTPILDAVYQAGYYDQPHLTRSLKQFVGYTPTEIITMNQPE